MTVEPGGAARPRGTDHPIVAAIDEAGEIERHVDDDDMGLPEMGLDDGVAEPPGETGGVGARRRTRKATRKAGGDGEEASPGDAGERAARVPRVNGFSVERLNREWAIVLMGSKAVMLREQPDAPLEERLRVLSIEAFRAWYANRYTEHVDKDGEIKAVSWAAAWLTARDRRQYAGITFVPNAPGEADLTPAGYFNLWRPVTRPDRGLAKGPKAYATFRDHLLNNVCDGSETLYRWVFGWFAHILQRPRERIGTALVLRGKMGTGKTKVGEVFGSLIPRHYFMVDDPRYVTGQFNAHMASCLLLQAEEAVWAGDKAAEGRLKGLITSHFQMIEQKGIDPIRLDNHVRLIMTSNEGWVVPAGKDERRFCVLDVHPRVAQDHGYFAEMDRELDAGGREALLADLLAFDLTSVNLRQIPLTAALLEQKVRSLDSIEAWWLQRLVEGAPTTAAMGWPDDGAAWCDDLHADYVAYSDRIGVKRRGSETEMGMALARLLTRPQDDGEASTALAKDRPWCSAKNRRRYRYRLPPLATCRALFDAAMSQPFDWPSDAGETPYGDDDV